MKNKLYVNYQPEPQKQFKKIALGGALVLSLIALMYATRPNDFEVFAATATQSTKTTTLAKASPSPSPSASPVASASGEAATESLKDRIDRILEQRQEKLKELEDAGQRRRAFIGEVQRITERTVTLHNRRGNQSFTIGPDVVLSKGGKTATIDDVAVGDWIGVIGFADKETIQPQIVIISSTALQPTDYETTIGSIKEVTKTQIVVTEPSQGEKTFQIVKTTQFQATDGTTIKRENLQTETQVIVLSKPDGSQNPATLIRSLAGQR